MSPLVLAFVWNIKQVSNFKVVLGEPMDSNVKKQLLDQKDEQVLKIPTNPMDQGKIANVQMGLTIRDKHYQGQMNSLGGMQFNVNLNPCARFYEKYSGQGFVEIDLPYDRGAQDFVFEWEVYDCNEFYFDFNDDNNFKLFLLYSERAPFTFNSFSRDKNKITIQKNFFSFLGYNSPFFLVCQAKFRSRVSNAE